MFGINKILSGIILLLASFPLSALDTIDLSTCNPNCVKGKNKAVRILEILNGVSPRIRELKIQTKSDFETGIDLYIKGKFKESLKKMKLVLKNDSKDKAAELYIDRCNFYSKNGTEPNWDGIEKLDFK